MGLKSKFFGLGAALAIGATLVAPASASTVSSIGTVPVSVTAADGGTALTLGVGTSTGLGFGTVTLDAAQAATGGVKNAGSATLNIVVNDNSLFNSTDFTVTVRLDNGDGSGSYLQPSVPVPAFTDSSAANFQIPGRYLKITDISNPGQAKFTGSTCAAPTRTPWNGAGSVGAPQCVPRDNVNVKPIYKVSDPVGLAGIPYTPTPGPCRLSTGGLVPWDPSCPDPTFTGTAAKPIMYFRAGSGTVQTLQVLNMTLDVPAGVYPTTYTGNLIVEKVVGP